MATMRRKPPKTMGLFTLFGYDVRAWKRFRFLGGSPNQGSPLTFSEALRLTWTYPSLRAIFIYRLSHWCYRRHIHILPGMLWRMNISRFGLDIIPSISIGPGLYIGHPVGTVIMARSLGRNVSLLSAITIGMRTTYEFPVIGNDVVIGAGARILGGIVVADGATIGANAVVIDDVAPGATVVGIPAKPIKPKETNYTQQNMEIYYES
jgi:serine O-acetyltransferase